MHHLHSVYDISSSLLPIKPLFFVGLLAFISVSAYVFKRRGNEFFLFKRMSKLGALLGAIFCVIIILVASVVLLGQYFDNKHVYGSKQLRFVEGNVTGYRPMHSDKHRLESFDVKGVHFEYSDYDLSTGGYK
jgi:hypothetical protein